MEETMHDSVQSEREKEEEIINNKIINEEYKTWKKNSVFLYDILLSKALDWPTLTTQWLPDKQEIPGKPFARHRLLLGTNTSGQMQNYLQIADVTIPQPVTAETLKYNEETEEMGGYGAAKEPITMNIVQRINHPEEINKARYMPQNPNLIATMCSDGRTLFWDRSKHRSEPGPPGKIDFQMELVGHTDEGFGLNWNSWREGILATGTQDCTVRTWDVKSNYTAASKTIAPTNTYTHHSAVVNDVQWHSPHLLGTVSDDLTFQLLDTRQSHSRAAKISPKNQHSDAINSLAFHPKWDMLFATGSADHTVGMWDLRFLARGKTHTFRGHEDGVSKVEWSPHHDSILASAANDRRIVVYDLARAGMEQTPEEEEDGPPELLFMHGGHTNVISDFSWNKNDPWVLCSAAEDNLIQVWRPANAIVGTLPPALKRKDVSE
ncbi:Histone acetyltransferase type B subunit 2 [Cryomyces minteri]|uniref:Histone acetyltransferase type B subunit 2 n=1 Tax=Cryomyces minteri TaxID=331657 RepID=A0A4U0XQD4_9PEZI|nr:Histone acetyltransferase type B subunit 2 [Cryomyces minteri]